MRHSIAPLLLSVLAVASCVRGRQSVSPEADCRRRTSASAVSSDTTVYDSSAVSARVRRISAGPSRYPVRARETGLGGQVVLEAVIDVEGRVEPASIRILSATDSIFVRPSIEFITLSRYCPALRFGLRVRARVALAANYGVARTPD
jgi:hypothetical protein